MGTNFRNSQQSNIGFYADQILGDVRFDPDDSRPVYVGIHLVVGAATGDTNWRVIKFYYDGTSSNTQEVRVNFGAWSDRTTMF